MFRKFSIACFFATCALCFFSDRSEAAIMTVQFDFLNGVTSVASGQFDFDDSTAGPTVEFGDLSSFSFQRVGGSLYNLGFITSGPLFYQGMQYNPSGPNFQPLTLGTGLSALPGLLAAADPASPISGFFVSSTAITEYGATAGSTTFTSIVINQFSPTAVPEPTSFGVLCVAAAVASLRRRRINRGLQGEVV